MKTTNRPFEHAEGVTRDIERDYTKTNELTARFLQVRCRVRVIVIGVRLPKDGRSVFIIRTTRLRRRAALPSRRN